MKHLKLLLALVVSLFGMNVNAQDGSAVGEGQFFLYNVAEQAFLCGGNNWGTRDSVDPLGVMICTLSENVGYGGYLIKTGNNGTRDVFLGMDGYVDKNSDDGNYTGWTFDPVEGQTNTYTMKADRNSQYLVSNGDGKIYVMTADAPTDNKGYWKLLTREQLLAQKNLSDASESNPIDLTFLLTSPNFLRQVDGQLANPGALNNRVVNGWTVTTSGNNVSISVPNNGNSDQVNSGCEFWNNSYDIFQVINNAPNGKYIFAVDGYDTGDGVIYGNEVETAFTKKTGASNFATALANIADYHDNRTDVITVGGGTLKVGAKRTSNYGGKWCVLDNARLYYVGGVVLDDLIAAYEAALAAAQGVDQSAQMNVTTLANLQDALDNYSSGVDHASAAALTEATEALNNAASAANASISGYASADIAGYLARMAGVLELTNVYTTEAYNYWYADIEANYAAGTIPDDVVGTLTPNGAYPGGWPPSHETMHIDDVLQSAWTIGGTHYDDKTGPLYVNHWSTEGNNDESGMTTPFMEYWTSDGAQLDATTIVATIPGLNKSKNYKVTALVRVRQQDGQTKVDDGITFSVGDGIAVNAADGAVAQEIYFYKTVTAFGKPDDSGNLTITFTVKADSHISWLSFKNVMYEESAITQEMINELYASIQTPHNVKLDAAVTTTKAAVESSMSVADFTAFQEAVGAVNASAAEYATVKTALDEAEAIYANIKNNIPATEDALYGEIMERAKPAYEQGLIESSTQIGSCAVALAYIEQGIRRLVIKQNVAGSVVDRGYPESNLSGTDVTTGNVNVAYDGLAPWMISESKACTWHVNTWSGEGASDGSNLTTPFMEYWVWRAGNLDDVTISNTLTSQNLGNQNVTLYPNSVYEVSGIIRAAKEDGTEDITGVSIFCGDFENDLATEGTQATTAYGRALYGPFTVKGNTDANGNLTFGIKTKGTNANWIGFKNFSIKYISNNVDDLYKEAYEKMLAKAQADINDEEYADVVGAERDLLLDVISNDENVPTPISYKQGYDNLKDADDAFIAAKPAYDALAKAKSDAALYTGDAWPYASEEKNTALATAVAATATDATDALAKADEIIKAYREVVESNGLAEGVEGAVNVTTSLASYDADVSNWSGIGTNQGQGYTYSDGALYAGKYYDGGWSSSTGANIHVSQDVELPQGKYLLQISARGAFDLTNYTMSAFNGETELSSVPLPGISADANAGTFKNGWEDRFLVFDVTENNPTTIKIDATSDLTQRWVSFNNLRLIRLELYTVMADAEDYAALNAAIAAAEGNTLGFMDGEYAPYNNIAALQTLAEAKAIDQDAENTKDAITAMTASLNEAVWTANSGEVSAIDLTKCFDGSKDGSNRYYALGWGKNGGSDAYNTRIISGSEGNPGMAAVDNELALFTKFGTTYGTDLGYTMPLAANTLYKFAFKYGAFGENKDITTNLALASEDGSTTVAISPASFTYVKNSGLANSDPEAWFDFVGYFKIEDAGNYVLTLTKNNNGEQRQIVMGNISILSCEAIEIDENADYDNTLAVSGVDVSLKRTITASGFNTLVLPFDLTEAQIKAAFGDDAQVYAYESGEGTSVKFSEATAITANVPVLLTTSTASASTPYTFSNVDIKAATKAVAEGADIDFVGTYAAETSMDGKYFISGSKIFLGTDQSQKMKGTRAYLEVKSGSGINALSLNIDGENITAIQGIDGTITPKAIYNLQGQKVTTPVKGGIYIIDGKKTLVK
jgi:hypothetical protein